MKIAVASDDGQNITRHTGMAKCFVIYEIENGLVKRQYQVENLNSPHATKVCRHVEGHTSHESVMELLKGCQALITGGMRWRFAEDLKSHNIQPIVTPEEFAEPAITAYLKGELKTSDQLCQH